MPDAPPLRIAFFTHYTELYGANLSLVNLIEGLAGYGIRSHVVCPDEGDLLPTLARRGVPTAVIPFEWWVSSKPSLWGTVTRLVRNVRTLSIITARLREWGTDLVYTNSSVMAIGAMAAARLRLPHVWHLREFGDRDYDLDPDFGKRLSRRIFRTADATVFVSHALRRAFLGNAPPANSHVVYNGVARATEFDDRREKAETLRDREQPFTFVLVGRFRESKGQAVTIRAFAEVAAKHPDTRLLLVGGSGGTGDQAYYDGCKTLAAELGVANRVEFWGYVPDPERAFLAADVALMCSPNEAMGRVTAEAMSACRPVIGFDGGGTTELIDDGRTGLLYKGNADALAACMTRYVRDPAEAMRHGDAGWHVARERHTTEAYAARIRAILAEVMRRRGR